MNTGYSITAPWPRRMRNWSIGGILDRPSLAFFAQESTQNPDLNTKLMHSVPTHKCNNNHVSNHFLMNKWTLLEVSCIPSLITRGKDSTVVLSRNENAGARPTVTRNIIPAELGIHSNIPLAMISNGRRASSLDVFTALSKGGLRMQQWH